MKKAYVVCLLLVVVGFALLLRWPGLEIGFDQVEPHRVTVEASASERVVAANGGRPTAADKARAADRARWKAYYYAQLRAAELQGPVAVESSTDIIDMELGKQKLETTMKASVRAAPMADDAVSIEFDGDVVRARVALEVDAQRTRGRAAGLLALLASLRLRIGPPGPVEDQATIAVGASDAGQAISTPVRSTRFRAPAKKSPATRVPAGSTASVAVPATLRSLPPAAVAGSANAVRPMRSGSRGRVIMKSSGYIVVIPRSGPMVGVFPAFYDSRGTPLGSADDLAPERRLAGLPLLGSNGTARTSRWVGTRPGRYDGTVSRGDIFLRAGLSVAEALAFREALVEDHVVIVIDEDR